MPKDDKNNAQNTDNANNAETKCVDYKAIPVSGGKTTKSGEYTPNFVLRQIPGLVIPKIGDSVRFTCGSTSHTGTVHSINNMGVIALKLVK